MIGPLLARYEFYWPDIFSVLGQLYIVQRIYPDFATNPPQFLVKKIMKRRAKMKFCALLNQSGWGVTNINLILG
jgi:hypothetical protein